MTAPGRGTSRRRVRGPALGGALTAAALLLVWVTLVAPGPVLGWSPTPLALVRVPAEGILLVAALLALRGAVARWFAVVVGVVLGLLLVVRILDATFLAILHRPFNPLVDWHYAGSAKDLVGSSAGPVTAVLAVVAAVALLLGLTVLTPLAVGRLGRLVRRHRTGATRTVVAATGVWVLFAWLGAGVSADLPVASSSTVAVATREVTAVRDGLHDRAVFADEIRADPFHATPPAGLLTALRGKDVLVVFVESYGRVAIDQSPEVAQALTTGMKGLGASGYSSRSAWLTSPTFGGVSWLAHSSLQSGLWVDSQLRYDQLLATASSDTRRLTLARAFHGAGWRTVDVVPANHQDWPEGQAFYGYDRIYDSRTLGYAGASFGYAPVPDQYTLSAFDRLELEHRPTNPRQPLMAEIDLVTSHAPWAPHPQLVDWAGIGDGTLFLDQARTATPRDVVWRSAAGVRTAYGQTVAYSLESLVSFLRATHDDNLVVLVLGDHQPISVVSGDHASHDVPVSLIARDPAVFDRISAWGWENGLRPGPGAPVWPMDRFRDRFLTAYSRSAGG